MTAAPRLTKRQTKKRAARSFDAGRLKEKKMEAGGAVPREKK